MSSPADVGEFKGRVHFGVVTARADEYESVRSAFEHVGLCRARARESQPTYEIVRHTLASGEYYELALVPTLRQGNAAARTATEALIEDLDPIWVVNLGIAGSIRELRRFDVALATTVHDLRLARLHRTGVAFMSTSGDPQPIVRNFVTQALRHHREALRASILEALARAQQSDRERDDEGPELDLSSLRPGAYEAEFGSSDNLVDSPDAAAAMTQHQRYVAAIDMESAGVAEACYSRGNRPFLIVRGISDEVAAQHGRRGHKRLATDAATAVFRTLLDEAAPLDDRLHPPLDTADPCESSFRVLQEYYCHRAVSRRCQAADASLGDRLRLKSFEWLAERRGEDLSDPTLRPLIIKSGHVRHKAFLPGWDLAALLLYNKISLEPDPRSGRHVLEIDLRGEHEAIYDNRGKRFMADHYFGEDPPPPDLIAYGEQVHDLQMRHASRGTSWPIPNLPLPLRWASGGFLPIVTRRLPDGSRRRYFALFFRDISPVGWNIANGASEDAEERYNLDLLSAREAAEELVVLSEAPDPNRVSQVITTQPLVPNHPESRRRVLDGIEELISAHFDERRAIEGLDLAVAGHRLVAHEVGPTDVDVTYELDGQTKANRTDAVYITINPLEFGIEVTRIGKFNLGTREYLIDGETFMSRNPQRHVLVRRPVALFDLNWLERALLQPDGTYDFPRLAVPPGSSSTGFFKRHAGCRSMPVPPAEHFELYDYDVRVRRRLVDAWNDRGRKGRDFSSEARWLEDWEDVFTAASDYKAGRGEFPAQLLPVCSATWKAVCLFFQHQH